MWSLELATKQTAREETQSTTNPGPRPHTNATLSMSWRDCKHGNVATHKRVSIVEGCLAHNGTNNLAVTVCLRRGGQGTDGERGRQNVMRPQKGRVKGVGVPGNKGVAMC